MADIPGIERFGIVGWPEFDAAGYYKGPLPHECGHRHRQPMTGKNAQGGYNTAPTAAYPEGMCEFLAGIIFRDWCKNLSRRPSVGRGEPSGAATPRARSHRAQGSTAEPVQATDPVRVYSSSRASRTGAWDAPLRDPLGHAEVASRERVEEASNKLDEIGIRRPIKDELELEEFMPKDQDIEQDATTDEEKELNNMKRPKRGEGWWGQGPPIRTWRKSVQRDFVDGAGLCSPGRWPVQRRRLPEGHLVTRLKKVLFDGFLKCMGKMRFEGKAVDVKKFLIILSIGRVEAVSYTHLRAHETREELV
mgnify:CR=1 FL=1